MTGWPGIDQLAKMDLISSFRLEVVFTAGVVPKVEVSKNRLSRSKLLLFQACEAEDGPRVFVDITGAGTGGGGSDWLEVKWWNGGCITGSCS